MHPGEQPLFEAAAELLSRSEDAGERTPGVLTLTTHRIVFTGESKTIDIPCADHRHTHEYIDSIRLECHSSSWFSHTFAIEAPVAAILADIRGRAGDQVRSLSGGPPWGISSATIAGIQPAERPGVPPDRTDLWAGGERVTSLAPLQTHLAAVPAGAALPGVISHFAAGHDVDPVRLHSALVADARAPSPQILRPSRLLTSSRPSFVRRLD